MKYRIVIIYLFFTVQKSIACTTCNRQVQAGIYDSQFYPNLLTMLSAFVVLSLLVALLSWLSLKRYRRLAGTRETLNPVPFTTASTVLGIGLGGFADGIVLHQVLQFHEMLSSKIPVNTVTGKSVNMFWDGIFHLFCLLVVITGVLLMWKLFFKRGVLCSGNLLVGGLLLGWGLFNIIEGIIDHHLLRLHNVNEFSASPQIWNFGFLIVSVVLVSVASAILFRTKNYVFTSSQIL